jgi:hypothetical protein
MGYRKKGIKYKTKKGLEVRSKLEVKVLNQLDELGVKYKYEHTKLEWWDKLIGSKCQDCGSANIAKRRMYVPDVLLESGTVLEIKGRLTSRDRRLIKGIRKRYPELDYRLIFDRDNKISSGSNTRYSTWAEQQGIKYSIKGIVPEEWLK